MNLIGPATQLALFGKHPAAADHMADVGLTTPGLVAFKRDFYVEGVERQLSKGRWGGGEGEVAYGHWVMVDGAGGWWVADVRASRDAKGRGQYPLVAVVEVGRGEGLGSQALAALRRWLDRVHAGAREAKEMDGLRGLVREIAGEAGGLVMGGGPGADDRRRFLERVGSGPDLTGILRVLHGFSHAGSGVRRCRVPLEGPEDDDGAVMWLELLRAFYPEAPERTLIWRQGWALVDVVLAPPQAEALKHLMGPPDAPPLTTAVPYEMDAGFVARERTRLARWAETGSPGAAEEAPAAPVPLMRRLTGKLRDFLTPAPSSPDHG